MNEEPKVTITVEELIEYVRAKQFVQMLEDMIYESAYLSYDGESLRGGATSDDFIKLFRFNNGGRYKKELFFKQQEKRDSEDEKK